MGVPQPSQKRASPGLSSPQLGHRIVVLRLRPQKLQKRLPSRFALPHTWQVIIGSSVHRAGLARIRGIR